MAQLVAHHTGSVGVTGSNPVSSTRGQLPIGLITKPVGSFFVVMKGNWSPD